MPFHGKVGSTFGFGRQAKVAAPKSRITTPPSAHTRATVAVSGGKSAPPKTTIASRVSAKRAAPIKNRGNIPTGAGRTGRPGQARRKFGRI